MAGGVGGVGRLATKVRVAFAIDDHGAEPWSFYMKLLGTEGAASLTWRSATINRPMNEYISFTVPPYKETSEHVAAAFRAAAEGRQPLISTVDDAVECNRIIAAAYSSIESGCLVRLAGPESAPRPQT